MTSNCASALGRSRRPRRRRRGRVHLSALPAENRPTPALQMRWGALRLRCSLPVGCSSMATV